MKVIRLLAAVVVLILLVLAAPPASLHYTINQRKPLMTSELYVSGHARPHPELCPSSGTNLRLLILVSSAPTNFFARNSIRKTWGRYAKRPDVSIAFFIGVPKRNLASKITVEDTVNGDIIEGKFIDTYTNLTLKTLSMLEWVDTYCPRVPRLLKADDDAFINVPLLLNFSLDPSRVNATKTIWGRKIQQAIPERRVLSPLAKHYTHWLQYPHDMFPDYLSGPAYLLTTDVVKDILTAALREPYLLHEDVFVTGVLGNRVGIRRQNVPEFYNARIPSHLLQPCMVQRGIAIHKVQLSEQMYYLSLLLKELDCPTELNIDMKKILRW